MDLNKQFGDYIRKVRKQRKMTTVELAEHSGVSQSYISQIETGKRSIPTDDILLKLSQGLGISYSELLEKAGRKTSAFDGPIRSYIHLLIGDRERDFLGRIEQELDNRIGNLFKKHGVDPKVSIRVRTKSEGGVEIANQYANMILSVDDTNFKWDVLQELQDIAHEFHIKWNPAYEAGIRLPRPKELREIILNENITYNGHPLDENDRKRILDMLAVLFPDLK